MKITRLQVQNVLNTLPIGYYLGRKVEVKLGNRTCYNLMTDIIEISFNEIETAMRNCESEELVEDELRYNLYHEVSHACITPRNLTVTRVMNIFEDERIESLLKNFYMGVDFKETCKRRNNYDNAQYTDEYELFFEIVRFRRGPIQFTHRVHELIMEYRNLTENETWYYEQDVHQLFRDVRDYFNEEQQREREEQERQEQLKNNTETTTPPEDKTENEQAEEEETEDEGNDENDDSTADEPSFDPEPDEENEDEFEEETEDKTENEQAEEELDFNTAQQTLAQNLDKYDSPTIDHEVSQLLRSIAEQTKNNGSAINAYSGRFDPRSVVRKDCKYFVQENRAGHIKHTQTIKLNLFIDCSGSFRENDDYVNTLLKALIKFERMNKHFSFDMIACSIGERLLPKKERFQCSNGGTAITANIKRLYDQVQQSNAQNINICLYDGDCCWNASDTWAAAANLKTFDNNKSVLILDSGNKCYVDRYISQAKVIITDNYTEELYKNVFNALRLLVR